MIGVINDIASLILVPVLTVLLVLVLIVLIAPKKSDTLATLAYELQKLIALCGQKEPDAKFLKKADMAAAKCALLADRASFEQKQDIGNIPDKIAAARKILHALHTAKPPKEQCGEFLEKAVVPLKSAYSFLIGTLGITAAPGDATLKFFRKNMRSENAKKYLESIKNGPPIPSDEEAVKPEEAE